MDPICIYHGGCDDGFAAALCVWIALAHKVELFAGVYGKPPPNVTGREVIIVDFSYKRAEMEILADKAKSILMLDHHKSAMEDMDGFSRPNCKIFFNMDKCGASMVWDYFHEIGHFGINGVSFIAYIQDRDLWKKELQSTDEFTMGLRSYPQDLRTWESFFREKQPIGLIQEGIAILRYYRKQVEEAKVNAFDASIDGVVVPVCNSTFALASDVAGELAEGKPFAAVFYQTSEGYVYSLSSRGEGMDVSKIALKFGGGGHKQAAGFKSKAPVHKL